METSQKNKTQLIDILGSPSISLITGGRGSGKTAFGMEALREARERGLKPHLIGLPESKWGLLPDYITPVRSLDSVPDKSAVFLDEAYLYAFARDHPRLLNKYLYKILGVSRHKDWVLAFATHTTRKLDVGVIIEADNIVIREPTWLHVRYERVQIRKLIMESYEFFRRKREPERVKHAIIVTKRGAVAVEPSLPDFWSEELSKGFSGVSVSKIGEVE